MNYLVHVSLRLSHLENHLPCLVLQVELQRCRNYNFHPRGGSIAFHTLQAIGTTRLLVLSLLIYWVVFMVFFCMLWHRCMSLSHHNSNGFRCYRSNHYEKVLFWAHVTSFRHNSNTYVSPLACCTAFIVFLTILQDIFFDSNFLHHAI